MHRFDGTQLRARRRALGVSVEQLAQLAQLSYTTVVNLERNQRRPSMAALERLCDALTCEPTVLFTDESGDNDDDERPSELGAATDAWIKETLATAPPMTKSAADRVSRALFNRAAS